MTSTDPVPPTRPAHDPLSEEMDLITWQEAGARVYDELVVAEAELKQLKSLSGELSPEAERDLVATQRRVDALHRVAERIRAGRPEGTPDRTPSPGWS